MSELDDQLQRHLEEIEHGKPVNEVLAQLPAGQQELASLIKLAAGIRQVRHPLPQKAFRAALPANHHNHRPAARLNGGGRVRGLLLLSGVVGAAALAFVVVFLAAAAAFWYAGPHQGSQAKLIDLQGQVRMASAARNDWRPVAEAQTLRAGQRLRTGADSGVTLVFYDGSRATLAANSEVTLQRLQGAWNRTIKVEMLQHSGATLHSVVPMGERSGLYLVHTSAGTARVHGTVFSVTVEPSGPARFAVERGQVEVDSDQGQVMLSAGQATAVQPGSTPLAPAYQFVLRGQLERSSADEWQVNRVAFRVNDGTTLFGNLPSGATVLVTGRTLADGSRVADQLLEVTEDGENEFTGIVESIDGDLWTISGQGVWVMEGETEFEGEPGLGDTVRVKYQVLEDGRWLALEIESLEEEELPVVTEQPITDPIATLPPTEEPYPGPVTGCTGANPQPTGQKLANRYGVPYEEIMGWFCQKFGFGEIDLAYELSKQAGVSPAQIFELRRSGLGWGEIKKMVEDGLITATETPVVTEPVVTEPVVTEPVVTEPVVTEPVVTPVVTEQPPLDPCTGGDTHPTGAKLASRYGVSYNEIMRWFCQGMGFGEIELAYSLSQQSGAPVAQIFAMRQSGMGWGEIKQQLSPKPVKTKKP